MSDVSFIAGLDNGSHYRRIVQFLRLIDFVSSGIAARMVVGDIILAG
jgi:hypothetical protein